MLPKPKRQEMESLVCDLQKKVAENKSILDQKEIALHHARIDLAEHAERLSLHDTNMKYMKFSADLVDIKEFRGVQKLLDDSRANHAEVALKVTTLTGAVQHFRNVINKAQAEIDRYKAEISDYGRIIPWRTK